MDIKNSWLFAGNTRIIFEKLNDTTYTAQANHYGAWGEVLQGLGTQAADPSDRWNFLFQGKEYVDAFGYNSYDFGTRQYDQNLGLMRQIDGANQFASGYTSMGNMPTVGIDPDGQWLHIVIGAAIGGTINLATHWNKAQGFKQKLLAFGIGAAAGAVTAATGGAAVGAFGLSATSIAGGAFVGAAGAAAGGPIQGFGNMLAFGDSYTVKDFGLGVVGGAVFGGATNAVLGKFPNFANKVGKLYNNTERGIERALGFGKKGFVIPEGFTSEFPDWVDAKGVTHKGGVSTGTNSLYDQAMQGVSNDFTSFYHKGNLDGGIVRSSGNGLSTSMDRATVDGLERAGKVWEFKIPKDEFTQWQNQGLVKPYLDYDFKTGVYNQELRFSPKLAPKLNKYIVR